jgi:hypothetical protein
VVHARINLNQFEPDDCDGNAQPLWAERQTDYTGIDPLQCPNCDKPFKALTNNLLGILELPVSLFTGAHSGCQQTL